MLWCIALLTPQDDEIEAATFDAQPQGLNHVARPAEKKSMQTIIAQLALVVFETSTL